MPNARLTFGEEAIESRPPIVIHSNRVLNVNSTHADMQLSIDVFFNQECFMLI